MGSIIKHLQPYCRLFMTIKSTHIVYHTLYILEGLSPWGTSGICPSLPRPRVRLNLLLVLFTCVLLVCHSPLSILLFAPTIHVSHMHPPLPTGQLNTSTQVNNKTMLHLIYSTWSHISTSHSYYYSFPSSYFFHTFGQASWPDPSCWEPY
jgi:hypothetical protein